MIVSSSAQIDFNDGAAPLVLAALPSGVNDSPKAAAHHSCSTTLVSASRACTLRSASLPRVKGDFSAIGFILGVA